MSLKPGSEEEGQYCVYVSLQQEEHTKGIWGLIKSLFHFDKYNRILHIGCG